MRITEEDRLIAARLRGLLTVNRMTNREVAQKVGTTSHIVANWATARTAIPAGFVPALAQLFGITPNDLLNTDEDWFSRMNSNGKGPRSLVGVSSVA